VRLFKTGIVASRFTAGPRDPREPLYGHRWYDMHGRLWDWMAPLEERFQAHVAALALVGLNTGHTSMRVHRACTRCPDVVGARIAKLGW